MIIAIAVSNTTVTLLPMVEVVHRRAGGKGFNVARVLEQLGVRALVTGFVGGTTGQAIRGSLQAGGFQERCCQHTRPVPILVTGLYGSQAIAGCRLAYQCLRIRIPMY